MPKINEKNIVFLKKWGKIKKVLAVLWIRLHAAMAGGTG